MSSITGIPLAQLNMQAACADTVAAWERLQQQQIIQRCECHDCTQARWKMSMQGQVAQPVQQG